MGDNLRQRLGLLLALLLPAFEAGAYVDPPTFSPAQPTSNDVVVMTTRAGYCHIFAVEEAWPAIVTVDGSSIDVIVHGTEETGAWCIFPPVLETPYVLGKFPAGTYTVRFFLAHIQGPPPIPGAVESSPRYTAPLVVHESPPATIPASNTLTQFLLAAGFIAAALLTCRGSPSSFRCAQRPTGNRVKTATLWQACLLLALASPNESRAYVDSPTFSPERATSNDVVVMNFRSGDCHIFATEDYRPADVTIDGTFIDVIIDGDAVTDVHCVFPPVTENTFAIGRFPAGIFIVRLFRRSFSPPFSVNTVPYFSARLVVAALEPAPVPATHLLARSFSAIGIVIVALVFQRRVNRKHPQSTRPSRTFRE